MKVLWVNFGIHTGIYNLLWYIEYHITKIFCTTSLWDTTGNQTARKLKTCHLDHIWYEIFKWQRERKKKRILHLSYLITHQTLVSWGWCLEWWICWSCKLFNAAPPDLLFQRLSSCLSSSGFCTLLITGRGGSIFSTLMGTTFSFLLLLCLWFLGTFTLFTVPRGLLPQLVAVGAVALMMLVPKFLPEKSFLSLEYLTLGEMEMLVVLLLVVRSPTILLCLFTWPMQPILGDKGSLEKDPSCSLHCGRLTSLMDGLEHSIGRNVLLWWICRFWW